MSCSARVPARFRAQIEAALALEGGHFAEDVEGALDRREVQPWETETAYLITEVYDAPRQRVLNFWLAAGELGAVLELSDIALGWGREQGCVKATFTGRRGWERVLARRGWTSHFTTMGRPI